MTVIQDMKHLKDEMVRFCDMHAHDISKGTYDSLCGAIYCLWSELDDREVKGMTELKPCPFCGSTDVEIRNDERDCCYIQCLVCDAWVSTGVFEPSYEDIVELWNRRVKE